jgi:hypothetical protein
MVRKGGQQPCVVVGEGRAWIGVLDSEHTDRLAARDQRARHHRCEAVVETRLDAVLVARVVGDDDGSPGFEDTGCEALVERVLHAEDTRRVARCGDDPEDVLLGVLEDEIAGLGLQERRGLRDDLGEHLLDVQRRRDARDRVFERGNRHAADHTPRSPGFRAPATSTILSR